LLVQSWNKRSVSIDLLSDLFSLNRIGDGVFNQILDHVLQLLFIQQYKMGGAQSAHQHHHHHKNIKGKIGATYEEDGVIVLSDDELKHLWEHYDDNKNDLLDEYELENMVKDLVEHTITDPVEREKIRKQIDANGPFVPTLHKQLDHDKDGKVNFADFVKSYHHIMNHYLKNH